MKWVRRVWLNLLGNTCMQRQTSVWDDCAQNGWMDRYARFHHRNLMIYGSMEAPWLDLYWVGMNLQSGHRSTADLRISIIACALLGGAAPSTLNTPEMNGEIPGWYIRWARVCLSTPKPIKGGGFLQKSTKQ
jgi:hypothetical protein